MARFIEVHDGYGRLSINADEVSYVRGGDGQDTQVGYCGQSCTVQQSYTEVLALLSASAVPEVTDAMVERAFLAWRDDPSLSPQGALRAALIAALRPESP